MNFIDNIINRARNHKKRIVLPETMDHRVIEAAKKCIKENIADIIIIGDDSLINVPGATIINPLTSELTNDLINLFYEMRKEKGITLDDAKNTLLNDNMYFACLLVKVGYADGVVSGACHSSANTLRPALQIIKTKEDSKLVSSFFLMTVPNCELGENGVFLFSDAGLVQNPDSQDLAYIAKDSADSFELLVEKPAKVAFLSHSTLGSAQHPDVLKVTKAVSIAKEKYPNYLMDGEFQLDAAIVPEVAKIKAPLSKVAGQANTLIFPDLDAGNIGYKLVQRLGNASAFGPITQGIKKPINDLSRGCSVDDIVGVVAITAVQAGCE